MTKTATHIAQPARLDEWGMTVDKPSRPSLFVVYRYPGKGRRHIEPSTVAFRLRFIENAGEAVAELVKAGMPEPTARYLVMAVSAKLESPKVADADTALRRAI